MPQTSHYTLVGDVDARFEAERILLSGNNLWEQKLDTITLKPYMAPGVYIFVYPHMCIYILHVYVLIQILNPPPPPSPHAQTHCAVHLFTFFPVAEVGRYLR